MKKNVSLVAIGLVIGCGAAAYRPAAAAHVFGANTTGVRWEQLCYDEVPYRDASETVRKAGQEGFELASVTTIATSSYVLVCLKRRVQ